MSKKPVNKEENVPTPPDATELQEARVGAFVHKQLVALGEQRIPLALKTEAELASQEKAAEMMVAIAPGEERKYTDEEKAYSEKLIADAQKYRERLKEQNEKIENYLVSSYYADAMAQGISLGDLNAVTRSFAEVHQWIKRMAYQVTDERRIELQMLTWDILAAFGAELDIKYGVMDISSFEKRTEQYEKVWHEKVEPLIAKYKVQYNEMPAVLDTIGRIMTEVGERVAEDVVTMQELTIKAYTGKSSFEELTIKEIHEHSLGVQKENK